MHSKSVQQLLLICLLLAAVVCGFAIQKEDEKKSRVYDQSLSDEEHFKDAEHNVEYDHEAFLGKEEARTFDQLSPEESKKRLTAIVKKIDKDSDGFVTFDELRDWIHRSQRNYIFEDVDRQWKSHNPDNKSSISWDDYKKVTYGFMDDIDNAVSEEDSATYKEMMKRDKRRWELADTNKDGSLTKEEFTDFLHPEETEHMRDVVVEETLEDIDKNKDGKVSIDEYISDMYAPDASGDDVPDWVIREKEQFTNYRDKNKDGFMDKSEIREWIIPPDYDHSEAEAKHLIHESDTDRDEKLTLEEIISNYDGFVGSQATDFGEALMKHDEL
ncbi:calumenin-like protein [Leptotrombidium deliense]|uniref:Reticulocalbin-3 n=1 Tax=Leptotrombidium deliense TaxID=299467 RepID=A0A443SRR9_9ACAR|nr:calumenin-like protein [Leptotrombidium deliense]